METVTYKHKSSRAKGKKNLVDAIHLPETETTPEDIDTLTAFLTAHGVGKWGSDDRGYYFIQPDTGERIGLDYGYYVIAPHDGTPIYAAKNDGMFEANYIPVTGLDLTLRDATND